MSSCVGNKYDCRGGKDAQIIYNPSLASLNRVLNGTHRNVLASYTSRKHLIAYLIVHGKS